MSLLDANERHSLCRDVSKRDESIAFSLTTLIAFHSPGNLGRSVVPPPIRG
jgi:hypothetical protein